MIEISMKRMCTITSGFTLVELLVSVVVLGILASLGTSGFQFLIESQRSKNASFEMLSSLSLARSEAIKRNNFVTLTPTDSTNWGKGWAITYIDAITSDTKTIKSQSELKKIVISQGSNTIVYAPTGRVQASPLPFLLDVSTNLTENARCIKIELSGMPRVKKPVNGACV